MNLPTHILLGHGGGGQLMDQLLDEVVRPHITNPTLEEGLDSALLDLNCASSGPKSPKLAFTMDGYVVTPWKFPGGDIGRIAICGTVNDLAVCGARPIGIALGLILAEGLETCILREVMTSIAATAKEAGVKIVTGDTKVVGRGQADGIFITTAGVGLTSVNLNPSSIAAGDLLLINGPIADHGLAVMLSREMPHLQTPIKSDVAPLNGLIQAVLESGAEVKLMRDPTRSGVAGLAADFAKRTGRRIVLDEKAIPVRRETRHAAEMLGLDLLEVANEGKVVIVVAAKDADKALQAMRGHALGHSAAIIGQFTERTDAIVELVTATGGRRIVQKPFGEQLPRIC
jgi:hydrogenase expression/formation protein HypE